MLHSFQVLIAVALGGAIGAAARHLTSRAFVHLLGTGFPWGTLTVNVLGSFLMGVLIEVAALRLNLSLEWRAFLTVGVLGGFTTFSSFALDAVTLYERGELGLALSSSIGSVVMTIQALFAGLVLMRAVLT